MKAVTVIESDDGSLSLIRTGEDGDQATIELLHKGIESVAQSMFHKANMGRVDGE